MAGTYTELLCHIVFSTKMVIVFSAPLAGAPPFSLGHKNLGHALCASPRLRAQRASGAPRNKFRRRVFLAPAASRRRTGMPARGRRYNSSYTCYFP